MFYVLVSGKRDFFEYEKFKTAMDIFLRDIDDEITIVEGGAKGTDALAEIYALENEYDLKVFAADWKKNGRAAGPIRNSEMVSFVAGQEKSEGFFFWDYESKGTRDCLRKAEKHGIKCTVVNILNNHTVKVV